MPSPYSTGGGGFRFEDRVAAYYYACVLTETTARGLIGTHAVLALAQRAELGHPLDDLIVEGTTAEGESTRLSLQLKTKLTFTPSDKEWRSVVEKAWETVRGVNFDPAVERVGVGIATVNARSDSQYRPVLNWARYSASGADFVRRISQPDFSHKDRTAFVEGVREIIAESEKRAVTDEEVWSVLRSFVILRFDFLAEASSSDDVAAQALLQGYLEGAGRSRAGDIWSFLIETASNVLPAAGGLDRARIVDFLRGKGLPSGVAPSRRADVATLSAESGRALAEIRCEIGGLRLHRPKPFQAISEPDGSARFIQLVSEPGAGKSAILREVAEQHGRTAPLFVLKNDRIHPRGWPAHATTLGVTSDLDALVTEFAAAGDPILFIDGIDRIADPAAQITVNDILRAIATSPSASSWRIVATVREQNLKHLGTWLDDGVLQAFGVATVTVDLLSDDEQAVVGATFPRLRPLMREGGGLDVILSRPFFLDTFHRLASGDGSSFIPASEIELLELWWSLGGADRHEFAEAQRRRNALIQLAALAAMQPNRPIPIGDVDPQSIAELRSAGILRDQEFGHTVNFVHDIYEEWSLCELLIGKRDNLADFLKECDEPQSLVRAVQLLGNHFLEQDPSAETWKALLQNLAASESVLRPVWQRAILTAPLHSTKTGELLSRAEGFLTADNARQLRRLLVALRTIEVVPNPLFLDAEAVPNLPMNERVLLAQTAALPKGRAWVRLLDWLVPRLDTLPPTLIPDILPVLQTWQSAFPGHRIRHYRAIGEVAGRWVKEFEEARHPGRWQDRRDPFGVDFPHDVEEKLEKTLRSVLLASAASAPEIVSAYVDEKLADDDRIHMYRDDILHNSGQLAAHLPEKLVEFVLGAFIQRRPKRRSLGFIGYDDEFDLELGITDNWAFYPASPYQMPFLALLRHHEEQGLHLIHALTNHSVSVWRKQEQRRGREPLPVKLTFPWGRQPFWGGSRVYSWFRGSGAANAVESALMALEYWALEQLEAGQPLEALFEKIIRPSHCAAALGLGVSLSLAAGEKAVPASLPLVTCPHLWGWDVIRLTEDRGGTFANEIGDWHRHRHFLQAVRKLNQKPHRQSDIRALVPRYVFCEDRKIAGRYTKAIRSFPRRLPFEYVDESQDPDAIRDISDRIASFLQQGDPKNWRVTPTPDGTQVQLWVDPPYQHSEKHQEYLAEQAERDACMGLALWGHSSLEKGELDVRYAVTDGFAAARQRDFPEIFDVLIDADLFDERMAAGGVAGAAFAVARFATEAEWSEEIGAWCLDVFERAATAPEPQSQFSGRRSLQMMSPVNFAVHGYSALLARGFEAENCRTALISLAVDSMEAVATAVHNASAYYAAIEPDFTYVLFRLALDDSIYLDGAHPDYDSTAWSPGEADRKISLIEAAEGALCSAEVAPLPNIPMPWIETAPEAEGENRFSRNDIRFNHYLARKTVLAAPVQQLIADDRFRQSIVDVAEELLRYTAQEIVPPWVERRRDHRGNTPYEWIFAFSAWCGRLCAHLPEKTVADRFLATIFAMEAEAGLKLMESFMRSFMIEAFFRPTDIAPSNLAIWRGLTTWVFEHSAWREGDSDRHLGREYESCAFATLFCVTQDFGPLICGVEPDWRHLALFDAVVDRAVRQFGCHQTLFLAVAKFLRSAAATVFPQPALSWLSEIVDKLKSDQPFWEANGEGFVEALKEAMGDGSNLDPDDRRRIVFMADTLVDNGVRGAGFLQQELLRRESV